VNISNVNTQIDENLKDFINGEKNVLHGTAKNPVTVARSYKNGREYTSSYYGDISVPVTYGPNYIKSKKNTNLPTQEEIRTEKSNKNELPKGTGGQLAYVRFITKNKDVIIGLSGTACSIILHMCFDGIQWNTGKLVQERSKKPHTSETIAKMIDVGLRTAKAALKELSDRSVIKYDKGKRFYFLSADIVRKGVVIEDEDKI
jgi:hypothetical protein